MEEHAETTHADVKATERSINRVHSYLKAILNEVERRHMVVQEFSADKVVLLGIGAPNTRITLEGYDPLATIKTWPIHVEVEHKVPGT